MMEITAEQRAHDIAIAYINAQYDVSSDISVEEFLEKYKDAYDTIFERLTSG